MFSKNTAFPVNTGAISGASVGHISDHTARYGWPNAAGCLLPRIGSNGGLYTIVRSGPQDSIIGCWAAIISR